MSDESSDHKGVNFLDATKLPDGLTQGNVAARVREIEEASKQPVYDTATQEFLSQDPQKRAQEQQLASKSVITPAQKAKVVVDPSAANQYDLATDRGSKKQATIRAASIPEYDLASPKKEQPIPTAAIYSQSEKNIYNLDSHRSDNPQTLYSATEEQRYDIPVTFPSDAVYGPNGRQAGEYDTMASRRSQSTSEYVSPTGGITYGTQQKEELPNHEYQAVPDIIQSRPRKDLSIKEEPHPSVAPILPSASHEFSNRIQQIVHTKYGPQPDELRLSNELSSIANDMVKNQKMTALGDPTVTLEGKDKFRINVPDDFTGTILMPKIKDGKQVMAGDPPQPTWDAIDCVAGKKTIRLMDPKGVTSITEDLLAEHRQSQGRSQSSPAPTIPSRASAQQENNYYDTPTFIGNNRAKMLADGVHMPLPTPPAEAPPAPPRRRESVENVYLDPTPLRDSGSSHPSMGRNSTISSEGYMSVNGGDTLRPQKSSEREQIYALEKELQTTQTQLGKSQEKLHKVSNAVAALRMSFDNNQPAAGAGASTGMSQARQQSRGAETGK